MRATDKVVEKAQIVAHLLEAAPEDIEVADGKFAVKGSPDKGMTLGRGRRRRVHPREPGPRAWSRGSRRRAFYDPSNFVFPFGAHACVVEIDPETGNVDVVRYVAVDDCGPAINPKLIDGQVHGGIVHAIGQALYERVHYDENGQLVTATFVDYCLPSAADLPSFETRPHRDAVAGQLARRQGHRRGGHDRRRRRRSPTRSSTRCGRSASRT